LSVAVASALDFILHIPYVVNSCALISILPSLSLTDMIYCTPEKKPTLTSVQGVGIDFCTDMEFASAYRCETCSKQYCAIPFVFCSIVGPPNIRRYCAYSSAHTFFHLNYMDLPVYCLIPGWILQSVAEFRLRYVRLGKNGITVGKICFVFDFILYTAYTVDACALTRILPPLSFI